MAAKSTSVTFETTVAASGNNTGIVVPDEVIEQLAAGKRPPVLANVNGYEYRNTVAVMGGKHMISISAAVRNATGLKGGDPIRVTLTVADMPREVTIPPDLAAALAADEQASAFFGKLSNSMQRYHVDNITAAKSADTRQRRIGKAVACSGPASKGDDASSTGMSGGYAAAAADPGRDDLFCTPQMASTVGSVATPNGGSARSAQVQDQSHTVTERCLVIRCGSPTPRASR
jgi:hypothetical protein